MNHQYKKRKRSPNNVINHKRRQTSIDYVRKLLESEKGEPIQAIHTIFDRESFTFETHRQTALSKTFISFLNLKGYSFIGHGNNKTASRAAASKVALTFLLDDFRTSYYLNYSPLTQYLVTDEDNSSNLPDIIASLVLSKYKQLRDDPNQSIPWFKVIASIVVVRNNDVKNAKVIVLSTGSKCIEPKNIRLDGSVIVDSHAEILIRRSFQYFLYSQLLSIKSENSFLENHGAKYRIKPEISLYLFVNSAPCGDSRIFTVSDKDGSHDKHPNRISRGLLRIKLDGGNSTVPIMNFSKYDPKRLMVMSCSDKLLKINALGLQGSLLSSFIEPIYVNGIIIGDSFQESHLTRALYGRAEDIELRSPFKIHRPIIYGLSKTSQIVTKSPKTSVNWICGSSPEIIDSTTGKTMSGSLSRVCKLNLFRKFLRLRSLQTNSYSYECCKNECTEYQAAKKYFYEALESKRLGNWIRRHPSFDRFIVNKEDI